MINPEFQLKDHQADAVETAIKRNGNLLLSHPVGSGKTFTSIAAFEKLKEKGLANRVLVVTPASLRTNFGENGVKRFTDSNYSIYGNKQEIASDKTGTFKEPTPTGPEYGITSYELFRENPEKYIKGHNADTVVFDEVHRIRNDNSKIFQALKEHRGSFRNFLGMTGSISSNSPSDVVPLIDAMTQGNHRLGSKTSFENRFVTKDSKGNKVIANPTLVRALIAPYVHNVTDDQLEEGSGLKRPDKYVNEITVPLTGPHADYYRYAINQLDPITKAKLAHGLGKIGKAEMDAVFSKLLKSRQVANSMATMDPKMSLEESAEKSVKVKRLLDDVENHLTKVPDAQVLIHSELLKGGVDVLEAGLKKRGIEYGKFIGKGNPGVTEKNRQEAVDNYNAGKSKVLLISSAGGEGLDLPNTTMVASLDGHWNPEKINQVEARGVRMGGLSHRPEKDRKVIVNRYLTKLPPSAIDTIRSTGRLLNPAEAATRVLGGESLLYNPYKSMPTVDQLMYTIAKSKAKGNDQLKDLFEKTSAYSFTSDRDVLNSYLNKYQGKLLTGDYQDKWIDEPSENMYINKLKQYYAQANRKNVTIVSPKDYDKYKDRTPLSNAGKHFRDGALAGGGLTALVTIPDAAKAYSMSPRSAGLVYGGAILGTALVTGALNAWQGNRPHVTTSPATAKKRLKLDDESLRNILRGEAVRTEQIKTTDHFVRMK